MEKCTDTVVNWMIRCNAINEADKELYKYALYSFFLLVSPLILAGVIGFGLGSVKHGVALIFPFVVLRKFSGGYHAKNLHTCILGSGFLLFLCIMLSMHGWAVRYSFIFAGKVHLYNLFFCWDITDSRLTSTLYRKENV